MDAAPAPHLKHLQGLDAKGFPTRLSMTMIWTQPSMRVGINANIELYHALEILFYFPLVLQFAFDSANIEVHNCVHS